MACTPLNIENGPFVPESWSSAPAASFDGKTLTKTTSGGNPGIAVSQGSNNVFHAQLANHDLSYMVLGNKFLLILDLESGSGASTRHVSLVNFATWDEVPILTVLASSNQVTTPIVQRSAGNATAFLVWGSNGAEQVGVAIHRSDNGATLCSLGSPIIATGQTGGEATATQLIIHYSTGGTSKEKICPKPVGECDVSPASQTFSDVHVGGCPFTPQTKQFTIKNVGDDCLTVNSIGNSPPFAVQSTSSPLSAVLGPNETVSVTVAFNPTAVGTWTSSALPVVTTPANGDNQLICKGKALAAAFSIQFNATTIAFGSHPVGTPAPGKSLTITNNGSKPLSVTVPQLSVSGFGCSGWSGTLNCGQSHPVPLSFTPPAEGPQSAMLSVTSEAPGSPHQITLTGAGCVPNAVVVAPSTSPLDFGQVQQGFRTVRIFKVENTGDGPLSFEGSIGGADAGLFGLPDPAGGSVTNTPGSRSYTALPVTSCGPGATGSGQVLVAVAFFANQAPGVVSATLTIDGHNATNFPASQEWVRPLTAEIVPPVALDVGLVIDRSGSMNDALGSRLKIDAAISAGQLFVELLRADLDDRVAIAAFSDLPAVIVEMTAVSSTNPPTQTSIRDKIATDVPPAGGNTAIAGGAIVGGREVEKPRATAPPDLTKALVVLSDGIENRAFEDPPGSGTYFSILGGVQWTPTPSVPVPTSPMPRPPGVDIYAIGLGRDGEIDVPQLTTLAGDPSHFFRVDQDLNGTKFFELEKYYTQIFMDIVGMASVKDPMFWISPGETHEIEIDVLRGDVGALVVVYDFEGRRLPFFCLSPSGEVIDPVSIPPGYQLRSGATSQARFVEFKMPLKEPDRYAGRWKVIVEHPGRVCVGMPPRRPKDRGFLPSRCRDFKEPILYGIAVGVGSNFRMQPYVTPGLVYVGDPILLTAAISEAGLPVTGCDVSVVATDPSGATWSLELRDDGAHSDGDPDDGEYARSFMHTYAPGTYHFLFRATGTSRDGEPVVREAARDKAVLPQERTEPAPPDDRGDECCEKLLKEVRAQTRLLRSLAKQK